MTLPPDATAPPTLSAQPAERRVRFRERLVVRQSVALLPLALALLGTTLWHAHSREQEARTAVVSRNSALAADLASRLQARVSDAHALLTTLSTVLDTQSARQAEMEVLLREVLSRAAPNYTNLWYSDAAGRVMGYAHPDGAPGHGWVGDRAYFQQTMRSGQFTISEPIRSRRLQPPTWGVVFAMPLRRPGDRTPRGIVAVTMTSAALQALVDIPLPAGGLVTVVDSSHRILLRTADADRVVGTVVRSDPLYEQAFRGTAVVTEVPSLVDGVRRIASIQWVRGAPWIVSVGIPSAAAFAQVHRQAVFEGYVLIAVMLFAVALAWWSARRLTRPIETLTHAANAHAAGHPVPLPRGEPGEVGMLTDAFVRLTEQVRLREQALASAAARSAQLFDGAPVAMLEWELPSRRIVAVNAAAVATYGHRRETLLTLSADTILDPAELAALDRATGETTTRHFPNAVHRHANGTAIDVDSHATLLRGESSRLVVHAAIDVTARRAAERALEESREQLRQAQKLEALGAFAGGIAHDFNNHLSAILGFGELALLRQGEAGQRTPELPQIVRAAQRAADLTRQLLIFAKRQPIALTPIDLAVLLDELTPTLHRLLGDGQRLITDLPATPVVVRGDRGQLEQVLLNLVTNARDAMPDGGEVHVSITAAPPTEGDARATAILRVRDTGIGMPEDVRARVFEPFFTTKSRSRGSGLGLSIVYGITQRMGGQLDIDSAVGAGTTMTIALPTVAEAMPTGDASAPLAVRDTSINATVLLVDDDEAVRSVSRAMLERAGCRVLTAASGPEALDVVARAGGQIDLLVTDMVMPQMSGRQLAQLLHRSYPQVRVLYMSGYTDDEHFQAGLASEAIEYLPKPFSAAVLTDRIRQLLAPPVDRATARAA